MTAPQYVERSYAGAAAVTSLGSSIGASDTSFSIASAVGWPTGSSGPFVISVDKGLDTEEKILCASLSGTEVEVYNAGGFSGRGYDGTTAQGHSTSGIVVPVWSATEAEEANQVVYYALGPGGGTPATNDVWTWNEDGHPGWAAPGSTAGLPQGKMYGCAGQSIPPDVAIPYTTLDFSTTLYAENGLTVVDNGWQVNETGLWLFTAMILWSPLGESVRDVDLFLVSSANPGEIAASGQHTIGNSGEAPGILIVHEVRCTAGNVITCSAFQDGTETETIGPIPSGYASDSMNFFTASFRGA
jgi:hypothetical protein